MCLYVDYLRQIINSMDYKQKSEQYRVSIRKKNINEKMGSIRAKQKQIYPEVYDPKEAVQRISNILTNSSIQEIYKNIKQIKLSSQNKEVMHLINNYFQTFYSMILDFDAKLVDKSIDKQQVYNDLMTVLINISSERIIDPQNIHEDIATPLVRNIYNKKRQINTIWLISNLLYRHNNFSAYFMRTLVKQGIIPYTKQRLNLAFQSQVQMTIFFYFVGALTTNLDVIQPFSEYKNIISVLQQFSQLQIEQLYWFLLDGLIQHAYTFNKFDYEIFSTKILSKCQIYCKGKKSRFVIKYLEIISHFLQGESQQLYKIPQQGRKKIFSEQYQRLKKNSILKNLDFCLDNRSPEVKRNLFEIGYMLIALYNKEISYMEEYFYLTLAEQIKNIQKYQQNIIIWFLKYFRVLISSLLEEGSVRTDKLYTQVFVKFVQDTTLFSKINYLIENFENSHQILQGCMDTIAFLLEYRNPCVNNALKKVNIVNSLQKLQINQQRVQIYSKRDRLLDFLINEQGL